MAHGRMRLRRAETTRVVDAHAATRLAWVRVGKTAHPSAEQRMSREDATCPAFTTADSWRSSAPISGELLADVAEALLAGGVDVMEVTFTVPRAAQVLERVAERLSSRILLGAGTVLDPETARVALLSGAEFIVSPDGQPRRHPTLPALRQVGDARRVHAHRSAHRLGSRRRRRQDFSLRRHRAGLFEGARRTAAANSPDADRRREPCRPRPTFCTPGPLPWVSAGRWSIPRPSPRAIWRRSRSSRDSSSRLSARPAVASRAMPPMKSPFPSCPDWLSSRPVANSCSSGKVPFPMKKK